MDFKLIWLDDFSAHKKTLVNQMKFRFILPLWHPVQASRWRSLQDIPQISRRLRTMHSMNFLNITSVRQPTSLNWELQEMLFCILWVCCDLTQKLQIKKTQVGKHPSFSKNLVSFKLAILSSCMASSLSWTVPASTWVKVYRTSRFGGEMWTRSLEHTVLMDSVLASYMVYMFCFF